MARPVDAEALEKKISEWLGQPGNGDYYSGYDDALCAVQDLIADAPTLTPPNDPLTIEQLREMDGEPVWAKLLVENTGRKEGWALVYSDDGHTAVQRWTQFPLWYKDYGKTWIAYVCPANFDRERIARNE